MPTFTRSGTGSQMRAAVAGNTQTATHARALRAALLISDSASVTDTALASLMAESTGAETPQTALEVLRLLEKVGAGTVA